MEQLTEQTALYRHWDAGDNLLYVGISISAVGRLSQHKRGSHWSDRIARVTIEKFPTRSEAEAAELLAIQTENPLHNIVGAANDNARVERTRRGGGESTKVTKASVKHQEGLNEILSEVPYFIDEYHMGEGNDYAGLMAELGSKDSKARSPWKLRSDRANIDWAIRSFVASTDDFIVDGKMIMPKAIAGGAYVYVHSGAVDDFFPSNENILAQDCANDLQTVTLGAAPQKPI